uniref:Bromo domain-containing protein n=1 Tax=Aegilops tauschii subsp. strangulata TaxID=200361 RepID=A0A453QL85_AEGTS
FQITSHEWSAPFLQPVDVVGLQLDDYHKIITKPMDFSTIQNKMEGKDGTKYKSVREIYSDVRLIFTNAMTYNDEHHDVHIMAKLLLEKFEEKWLQLLPKVENEERKQQVEPNDVPTTDTSPEDAIAKLAKDTDDELNEINKQLEMLRNMVVQRCRKMTTDEKRKLGAGLCHLTPDDLSKALELVAQDNPDFQTTAEEVDLDMDAQSETTLWRLKFFVREALERQANAATAPGKTDENAKRKRDIYNALAKTASKRIRR